MSIYEAIYLSENEYSAWDSFVDSSPQGCIFCRSWWLRAVCPDGFKILTIQKGGDIIAGMPLPISRKFFTNMIALPLLTQTLGILLENPSNGKYETKLSNQMEIIKNLVEVIPDCSLFAMNFHYNFTNWLPFYWAGYRQTTRYTYVLEDISDLVEVNNNISHKCRNTIRKAENSGVFIIETDDIELFLELNRKTFTRQAITLPYHPDLVRNIDRECALRDARKIFLAKDRQDRIHAVLYVVYDNKSMYNLMQGADPELRKSGANSLAIWHSIKFAQKVTRKYDFEGSMIYQIERFYRSFGAIQKPYFSIIKDKRSIPVKTGLEITRLARCAVRRVGL